MTLFETAFVVRQTGEVEGNAAATQMPSVSGRLAKIYNQPGAAGVVYIGKSGVTAPDATADSTSGIPVAAGEDTGWLPISNLNELYYICANAADDLVYVVVG